MKYNLPALFIILAFLQSCKEQKPGLSNPMSPMEQMLEGRFWVSEDYLSCLETSLPKNCISEKFYAISFMDKDAFEGYSDNVEQSYIEIKIQDKDIFYLNNNDTIKLEIINDKLKIGKDTYVCDKSWKFLEDINFISSINANRFYDKYDKQLPGNFIKDSMEINYNPYYNIHFLKIGRNCNDLKIIKDSLGFYYVYRLLNGCDSKDINATFDKEFILKIRKR